MKKALREKIVFDIRLSYVKRMLKILGFPEKENSCWMYLANLTEDQRKGIAKALKIRVTRSRSGLIFFQKARVKV